MVDSLSLTKKLIEFETITPSDSGSLPFMETMLKNIGFSVIVKQFEDIDTSSKPTWNIYAYTQKAPEKNLTFIGHMDVVHPGHDSDWTYPPFQPTVENGTIYGRGVCDMKATIACFCVSAKNVIHNLKKWQGISMLLTYDEEGNAINGTKKMLQFLASEGFTFTDAITGEPTCKNQIGDTVKVGRRGSINFTVEVLGKQGHVAYPQLAKSPVYASANIITHLKCHQFDTGNQFFEPTNLEITGIETSTKETGIIPNSVKFMCNVRFNDEQTPQSIINKVTTIIEENLDGCSYKILHRTSGESFLLQKQQLASLMQEAILEEIGIKAELSTDGGTSDARFMKDYANVIEFGVLNKTAHKIDENVTVSDIEKVERVYQAFLQKWISK